MKILKWPAALVFDTDKPESVEQYTADFFTYLKQKRRGEMTILHHTHATSDWEYLSQYFAPGHLIFDDFTTSYFYVIHAELDTASEKSL